MNKAAIAQLSADLLRLSTVLCAAAVSQNPVELSTVPWAASVGRNEASLIFLFAALHCAGLP